MLVRAYSIGTSSYCASVSKITIFTEVASSHQQKKREEEQLVMRYCRLHRQITSTLRTSDMEKRPEPSSTEGVYELQTKAALLGSTHRHHRPLARLLQRGNNSPPGFILGCEEGAGRNLRALILWVRIRGTRSQATNILFLLLLPGLTPLLCSLSDAVGKVGAFTGSFLRKPYRTSLALDTECTGAACPRQFGRRQVIPL